MARTCRHGAIIGFGSVAEHGHLPAWLASPDFEIVAVADPSAPRRAAAFAAIPNLRTYTDYHQLLAQESLQFVDIASPPAFHSDAVVAAAERGLHVICEKPVTTSLADYRLIRRAIQGAKVVLQPVHNWKYAEAFQRARDLIQSGTLGRIRSIEFLTHRNGWAAGDWRAQANVAGGGILVDHGWHTFYLLLGLAQAVPQQIRARTEKRRYRDAEVEDTAICEIDFPDCQARIELTWAADERRTRWCVRGDAGTMVIEDDRIHLASSTATSSPNADPAEERVMAMSLSQGSHHPEWFPGVIDSFASELENAATRGAAQREAEQCLMLLTHAYLSAADGGSSVELPDSEKWLNEADG